MNSIRGLLNETCGWPVGCPWFADGTSKGIRYATFVDERWVNGIDQSELFDRIKRVCREQIGVEPKVYMIRKSFKPKLAVMFYGIGTLYLKHQIRSVSREFNLPEIDFQNCAVLVGIRLAPNKCYSLRIEGKLLVDSIRTIKPKSVVTEVRPNVYDIVIPIE